MVNNEDDDDKTRQKVKMCPFRARLIDPRKMLLMVVVNAASY